MLGGPAPRPAPARPGPAAARRPRAPERPADAPAPAGDEPPLRARAAARARPRAGAARRDAARRGAGGARPGPARSSGSGPPGGSTKRWRRLRRPQRLEPGGRQHRRGVAGKVGDGAKRHLARGTLLDRRPQVVQGHRQAKAGGDLEVGRVRRIAPEHALRDPVVHPLELARERRHVGADRLVVGAVHPGGGGDDRRGGPDGEPDRHPELGALGVAAKRRAIALQRVPEDPAHGRLEDLVAPALGLLDRDPLVGVRRIERRLGADAVELAGDLARARSASCRRSSATARCSRESAGPAGRRARSPASGRRACTGFPSAPASAARPSRDASRVSRRASPRGLCHGARSYAASALGWVAGAAG